MKGRVRRIVFFNVAGFIELPADIDPTDVTVKERGAGPRVVDFGKGQHKVFGR